MGKRVLITIAGAFMAAGSVATLAQMGPGSGPMGGRMKGPMMQGAPQHMGPMMGFGGIGGRGHGMGLMRLKMLDANKDGAVTLDEFLAPRTKRFAEIDKNGDGFLDSGEIEAHARIHVDYWSKRFMHLFDADKDGKVTRDELAKRMRDRFAMREAMGGPMRPAMPGMPGAPGAMKGMGGSGPGMQGAGSGSGSGSGAGSGAGAGSGTGSGAGTGSGSGSGSSAGSGSGSGMGKGRMGMRRGMGQGGPMSLEHALAGMNVRFGVLDKNGDGVIDGKDLQVMAVTGVAEWTKRFLARYDVDKDGRVSRDEFLKAARQRFADLDLDGDGRITEEDLPPAVRGMGLLKDAR